MALAERWLAHRFNRPDHILVDHFTYVFCSDGDLMEGISHEAGELAGHQKLGKLIWVYDDNHISIEGDTALASSTDQSARFASYGWQVLTLEDGNDRQALGRALQEARDDGEHPTLISLRTQIAFGSPGKAGTAASHGAPLGEEEVRATRENLGYPSQEAFWVKPEALAWCREECRGRGRELQGEWEQRLAAYREAFPAEAREFDAMMAGELPPDWKEDVPNLTELAKPEATRASSGKVLQGLAARVPNLLGGSADLGGSNKTDIQGSDHLLAETPGGRILHFGVREHVMGSALNGMALHGGLKPFAGTFLVFSDYMRPAIRLAALMELPVIYVFTHDSIGLGEDGPTHQPVEQLMSLRLIPNVLDLRPGDAAETAVAWEVAMERRDGPTFLSLTRQAVPVLDRKDLAGAQGLRRGGYVLAEGSGDSPDLILIASGSELHIALEARSALEEKGVATRVVSLPSWTLFAAQDPDYRQSVLPSDVAARVSVEAGTTVGWERWVGEGGASVGMDRFGASAPWQILYEEFGITAENAVRQAEALLRE
jgi:transketolase